MLRKTNGLLDRPKIPAAFSIVSSKSRQSESENALSRNYYAPDIDVLTALAAASGMNAVTIFNVPAASPAVPLRPSK
jgi:hypothetical protein